MIRVLLGYVRVSLIMSVVLPICQEVSGCKGGLIKLMVLPGASVHAKLT